MGLRVKMGVPVLTVALLFGLAGVPAGAQDKQHVVSLGDLNKDLDKYQRLFEVFRAHDIRYFFYIGGNDSMDTADKINRLAAEVGYELRVMGVPKTIDNDLAATDHCPGYGSVAKYLATAVMASASGPVAFRSSQSLRASSRRTVIRTPERSYTPRNGAGSTSGSCCGGTKKQDERACCRN